MITKLILRYTAWRRKRAISVARETFAKFGHDLSDFTDDEIERGLRVVSDGFAHLGFSALDAVESMKRIGGRQC